MQNLDDQGQPKVYYHIDALKDRHVDELLGICRGITFDNLVTEQEAKLLFKWMNDHENFLHEYPFNTLYTRLKEILEDDILDNDEATELLLILKSLIGENNKEKKIINGSTNLPLNNPLPDIIIPDKNFVFTGVFTIGTRKKCEEIVCDLGGQMQKGITKKTDYLVIGDVGSDHWVHSSYGRKIEKAVMYRDDGVDIVITDEQHWIKFV